MITHTHTHPKLSEHERSGTRNKVCSRPVPTGLTSSPALAVAQFQQGSASTQLTNKTKGEQFTCSHRPLPRQPQQPLLLEDEAASDEDAGADGQPQTDVEIILPPVLTHSEAGCVGVGVVVCHIYDQTTKMLTKSCAVVAGPDT